MQKSKRKLIAEQTVEIVDRGRYCSDSGVDVDLSTTIKACLKATRRFAPEDLVLLCRDVLATPSPQIETRFEVVNETTLSGINRLVTTGTGPIAVLNFASARNPGGGFLTGAEAQEESLARSSALYASQTSVFQFYEQHRAAASLLYSDSMIWTPECPVFRDDDGRLLNQPHLVSFITSPAPNAGAIATNQPEKLSEITATIRRRAELVLALAAAHEHRRFILGAWGCGVFRNDPQIVAAAFFDLLRGADWRRRFEHVVFSVLDRSVDQNTFRAFQDQDRLR